MPKAFLIRILPALLLLISACRQAKDPLVEQCLALKKAFQTNDRQKVASFFDFPIRDHNMVQLLAGDSARQVDRATFLKNYSKLIDPAYGVEFASVLKNLDPEELYKRDSLSVKIYPKDTTDYCYSGYEIYRMSKTKLALIHYTNTRDDIDIDDDAGQICGEFFLSLEFRLIHGHLKFRRAVAAG